MPLAVTHILTTIIVLDLYRDYVLKDKKLFSMHTVLIGGIAGLLPDIDIPLGWIFSGVKHGSFTHTPFFALLFLIPGLILFKLNKKKLGVLFSVISFGVFFHVFLDWFLGGGMHSGVMLLYPFSTQTWKVHLFSMIGVSSIAQGLDAAILIAWLWHEEVKHKIKDFI
jgi:membrane-bound metal-dependent hydrolase YbcI (DUF457 family)